MASKVLSGGDKLAKKLAELSKKVKDKSILTVGFQNGATYPDGESVAMVAAINEFGAPSRGQPPRPFFRNMIAKHSREWGEQLSQYLENNDLDVNKSLSQLGEIIVGELQDSITEFTSPPLSQSTIMKKGFDKPLIDTGHMLNSITYETK